MTPIEFVKKIFNEPDLPNEWADSILFGCTGFPEFFHTSDHIKEMAYQLRHAKRAMKRGFSIEQIYMGEDKYPRTPAD